MWRETFTESGRIQGAVVSFLKRQQVSAANAITAQDLLSYDGLKCVHHHRFLDSMEKQSAGFDFTGKYIQR